MSDFTGVEFDRIVSPEQTTREAEEELSLRPKRLREFIGQNQLKENLKIFIQAAQGRNEPLDHALLYGPPGLGKTTLANIIAHEMNTTIRSTSGPAIERPGDLAAILTNLEPNSLLFIDEIHRLSRPVEEILYPAMEDYQLDLIIGKGPAARTIKIDLPRFTLVGATTRAGLLTSPLRARFGIINYFQFYNADELRVIIGRSADILGVPIDEEGSAEIALRSRGTPRIANRLLRRVRDFAQVQNNGTISRALADYALQQLSVDSLGLDEFDRRFLSLLVEKFGGGPVGIDTLAAALNEERDTIEDVYEPYLIQIGMLNRTPRGRVATQRAFEHLSVALPAGSDQRLF